MLAAEAGLSSAMLHSNSTTNDSSVTTDDGDGSSKKLGTIKLGAVKPKSMRYFLRSYCRLSSKFVNMWRKSITTMPLFFVGKPASSTVNYSMFGEVEEAQPKRELIPLNISEEERKAAMQYHHVDEAAESLAEAQKHAAALTAKIFASSQKPTSSAEDPIKQKQKQIVDQIPTEPLVLIYLDSS
jgi:hypothetical protein